MKLIDLVDLAYRRGTYTSLKQVQAGRRFAGLVRTYSSEPDPAMAASVHLLGDGLINAAWRIIPREIQRWIKLWPHGTAEDQLFMLNFFRDWVRDEQEMGNELRGTNRRTRANRARADLAREHGALHCGPVRPTCAAVGTVLAAFARHTGARHFYAHVIYTAERALHDALLGLVFDINAHLRSALPQLGSTGLFEHYETLVKIQATNVASIGGYNFHPALVIQLSDGRWMLLDPNLGPRATLEEFQVDEAAQLLQTTRFATVAQIAGADQLHRLTERWHRESSNLDRLIRAANIMCPGRLGSYDLVQVAGLLAGVTADDPEFWVPLIGEYQVDELIGYGLFPDGKPHSRSEVRFAEELLDLDPDYVLSAWGEMLLLPVRRWIQRQWDEIIQARKTMPHISLELMRPSTGVAVTVLNNLRLCLGTRPRSLGGALIPLSGSQLVWYDSRTEAAKRGVPDAVVKLQAERTSALQELPRMNLHPFVAQALAAANSQKG